MLWGRGLNRRWTLDKQDPNSSKSHPILSLFRADIGFFLTSSSWIICQTMDWVKGPDMRCSYHEQKGGGGLDWVLLSVWSGGRGWIIEQMGHKEKCSDGKKILFPDTQNTFTPTNVIWRIWAVPRSSRRRLMATAGKAAGPATTPTRTWLRFRRAARDPRPCRCRRRRCRCRRSRRCRRGCGRTRSTATPSRPQWEPDFPDR